MLDNLIMAERTCQTCNANFKAKYVHKKYCSPNCRSIGQTKEAGIFVIHDGEQCKICSKCCKAKPLNNFYIDKTNKFRSACVVCVAARHKEYRNTSTWKAYNKKCKATSGRYSNFKKRNEKIGREVAISKDDFWLLVVQPCYYCHGDIEKTGCGLDRVDSHKGYTLENVVPCCKKCNQAKMDMSQIDFLNHVLQIAIHQKLCKPINQNVIFLRTDVIGA